MNETLGDLTSHGGKEEMIKIWKELIAAMNETYGDLMSHGGKEEMIKILKELIAAMNETYDDLQGLTSHGGRDEEMSCTCGVFLDDGASVLSFDANTSTAVGMEG